MVGKKIQNSIMKLINLDEVSIVAALLGGFSVSFGLISYFIKERIYLSESLVCVFCGILLGPFVLNVISPEVWGDVDEITKQFTRIVIAIQVMAAGVALPKAFLRKELKSLIFLLLPVMIWMWIISALAIWWMIPRLSFLESMCIASCVAPTDPVLANSVVRGRFAEKYVPLHLRNIISAESGANDGLGFPFLYISMYLIQMSPGPAVGKWAYYVMGYQVILSVILGFIIGYIARKSLRWAVNKNLIDKEIFLTFAVMLALFIMGSVALIGSDELLACFIAGNSFTWDDWFRQETLDSHIQQILDMILNLAVFIYIGAIMPFSSFSNDALGLSYWRLIIVALIILLFRRLPIVMALMHKIPALKTYREGLFAGWFGPIGVGAVFYSEIAKRALEEKGEHYGNAKELIKPVVLFMVLSSIAVHGISIPLIKIGKRVNEFSRTTSFNIPITLTSGSITLRRKNDSTTGKGETVENSGEKLSRPTSPSSLSSTDGQIRVETNNQEVENKIIIDTEEQTSQTMLSYGKKNIPISSEVSTALQNETVSVYDEYENTIVEDDNGRVFVIPNPP